MARKKPKKLDLYPLGSIGGADEFENLYPDEMMRLGALTAYWSLVEDALCGVLAVLLESKPKAEAAFYSTTNHKARRDMVLAVSKNSDLHYPAKGYLEAALEATKDAADSRNNLLHGLFKVDLSSEELLSVIRRPATKRPTITKKNILKEINQAIKQCELAANLSIAAQLKIKWPNWPDDFEAALRKGAAKKRKPSS